MITRRHFIQTTAASVAAASLAGTHALAATPLHLKHLPAGEHGFFRAPVLLSRAKDAILIVEFAVDAERKKAQGK